MNKLNDLETSLKEYESKQITLEKFIELAINAARNGNTEPQEFWLLHNHHINKIKRRLTRLGIFIKPFCNKKNTGFDFGFGQNLVPTNPPILQPRIIGLLYKRDSPAAYLRWKKTGQKRPLKLCQELVASFRKTSETFNADIKIVADFSKLPPSIQPIS